MAQGQFSCVLRRAVLELERAAGDLLGSGPPADVRASKLDRCGCAASILEAAKNRLEFLDRHIHGVLCRVVHESDHFP